MTEIDQSFSSFQEWVNKASSWLTRHPSYGASFKATCFDSKGRICANGRDMERARNEKAFPVFWVWPDQNAFELLKNIKEGGQ